jgi:hypothetical protein
MATVKRTPGPARAAFDTAMRDLAQLEAAAGWFSSSKYEDGTPVAYIATIQEFGSPQQGIDSRSFQRATLSAKQDEYGQLIGKGARAVMAGKLSARKMLDAFGLQVAGDIRKTIADGNFKALADSTLRARARRRGVAVESVNSDPLRDSNVMVNTLVNQTRNRSS